MMKNYIILRRSAIVITNYTSIPKSKLNDIIVKLTKFERPPHPNAPKPISLKDFLTETKKFNGEEVDLLYLPFSFDLSLLEEALPYYEIRDVNSEPLFIGYDDIELNSEFDFKNDTQRDIVDFLKRENNYKDLPFFGVDLIQAGTATGKSYGFIRSWVEQGSKRLLACFAKQSHLENFKSELLKFTNLVEDDIYTVAGQSTFKRIKDKHKVILIITKTISSSISDVLEYNGDPSRFQTLPIVEEKPKVVKLVEDLKIGEVLFDETHLGLSAISYFMMLINVPSITQLSATPNRSDYQEDRIMKYNIPEDYLVVEKEARLEVLTFEYDLSLTDYELMKCDTVRGFNNNIYHSIIEDKYFEDWYDYLKIVLERIFNNTEKDDLGSIGIALASPLSFISHLRIRLEQDFPNMSIGDFTSNTPIKKRSVELDKDIVLTTEKSFNGSVNPERMNFLIFHGCIRSSVLIEQISGRLRGINDNDCIFIDLSNNNIANVKKFWKARQRVFKSIAKEIHTPEQLNRF